MLPTLIQAAGSLESAEWKIGDVIALIALVAAFGSIVVAIWANRISAAARSDAVRSRERLDKLEEPRMKFHSVTCKHHGGQIVGLFFTVSNQSLLPDGVMRVEVSGEKVSGVNRQKAFVFNEQPALWDEKINSNSLNAWPYRLPLGVSPNSPLMFLLGVEIDSFSGKGARELGGSKIKVVIHTLRGQKIEAEADYEVGDWA